MNSDSDQGHEIGVYKNRDKYVELKKWDVSQKVLRKSASRVRLNPKRRGRKLGQVYQRDLPVGLRGVSRRLGMDERTIEESSPPMPSHERWRVIGEGWIRYANLEVTKVVEKEILVETPKQKRQYSKRPLAEQVLAKLKREGKTLEQFIQELQEKAK